MTREIFRMTSTLISVVTVGLLAFGHLGCGEGHQAPALTDFVEMTGIRLPEGAVVRQSGWGKALVDAPWYFKFQLTQDGFVQLLKTLSAYPVPKKPMASVDSMMHADADGVDWWKHGSNGERFKIDVPNGKSVCVEIDLETIDGVPFAYAVVFPF